jgi:hypothetical protein
MIRGLGAIAIVGLEVGCPEMVLKTVAVDLTAAVSMMTDDHYSKAEKSQPVTTPEAHCTSEEFQQVGHIG